ncbi:MAG: AgmX/PglI C-terminal domain-containing protein [Bdellovibrionota bacterium]
MITTLLLAAIGCASGPKTPVVDREIIRKVVFSNVQDVQKCYMQTIDRRPGAEGKLVAGWFIQPDGKTSEARIVSADKRLEGIDECILLEIGTWVFPRPPNKEGVDVTYPFFFSENGRFGESDE